VSARLGRAARALAYLAVSVPIALLAPLAALAALARLRAPACWVARLDRRAANRLLDAELPPSRGGRRLVAYLALKLPLTAALLVAALLPVAVLAALLKLGLDGLLGTGTIGFVGWWRLDALSGLVLCALAVAAAILVIAALDGLHALQRATARRFLAPRTPLVGPVREMLAESLGDHTVSVAYWLPDRERFVDEVGRPVELPAPGSGRAWTAVERDGRRVAAIIHDAALDTSPELVLAAAAASSLAIDNERLKADLRARVEELRVSRMRIVEAGYAARRRVERDLHDGAQQELVSLAIDLRMLKARLHDPAADPLIDALSERLNAALEQLRELARGIHPAMLVDHGLPPAINALAERAPLPVAVEIQLDSRLPVAVETAAYFVVAEALTNVARHAQANAARIAIARAGEELTVEVADDGVGGADLATGTGLSGLQDRLAAIGGTLRVVSPAGAGTHLRATIPCPTGGDVPAPSPELVA
jgi:signal transduction histidine kinase